MGPIKNFNLTAFIQCAEELLRADETLRALWVLDNLPGWYRDNIPNEVIELKRKIYSKLATPAFYARSDNYELTAGDNTFMHFHETLRGLALHKSIKMLNDAGYTPNFIDLGPGAYESIRSVLHADLRCKYLPVWLNYPAYNHLRQHFSHVEAKEVDHSQPTVYLAGEVIEHLVSSHEIRVETERLGVAPDIVIVSTPLYTFNTTVNHWEEIGDLGHLKTFCPSEFSLELAKLYPDYSLITYNSQIMLGFLVKRSSKFKEIIEIGGQDFIGSVLTKG